MGNKVQRIRDPLHNLIEFKANDFENTLWEVIQTPPFQRLRRITQLGFSDFVYPGATHSRFAHSIGVFHTARKLMLVIKDYLGHKFNEADAYAALAASLVHDLGHGPFSHAFEEVGKKMDSRMAKHEQVSEYLIKNGEVSQVFKKFDSQFPAKVANIIHKGPSTIYGAVVSSQFDADRLDYMRRDRLMTGTQHSAIDFDWLLANLQVGKVPTGVDEESLSYLDTFVLGPKSIHAAETYLLGLFQLYSTVYFHKATRGAEKILTELMVQVFHLVKNGSILDTGLSHNHPLVKFALETNNIELLLPLDDTVIWGSLPMMAEAKNPVVANCAQRLWHRNLYKCMDIRGRLAHLEGPALEKSCVSILEKLKQWLPPKEDACPRLLIDQTSRKPYKRQTEDDGPLNQVLIQTSDGRQVDICECSPIINASKPFHLFRVYHDSGDSEAKEFIEKAINQEVGHVS